MSYVKHNYLRSGEEIRSYRWIYPAAIGQWKSKRPFGTHQQVKDDLAYRSRIFREVSFYTAAARSQAQEITWLEISNV